MQRRRLKLLFILPRTYATDPSDGVCQRVIPVPVLALCIVLLPSAGRSLDARYICVVTFSLLCALTAKSKLGKSRLYLRPQSDYQLLDGVTRSKRPALSPSRHPSFVPIFRCLVRVRISCTMLPTYNNLHIISFSHLFLRVNCCELQWFFRQPIPKSGMTIYIHTRTLSARRERTFE